MAQLSYAVDLWGGIDVCQKWETQTRKEMGEVKKLITSRADAASDFGNRLVSLNDGGAGHDWARAVGGSHKRGEESLKQAAWIDRELVVPLKKWESETKGVAEELGRRARELQDKYDEHARTIAEARASHHAMADKGEKALREFEWAEKNKLLDAKERRRIESAHATLGPMVVEAEAKHDGAVKEGNAFLKQYVEHMTGILKGYEALERNRLIMSYRTLEEYRKIDPPLTVDALPSPHEVQQQWIRDNATGLAPPPPFEFVPYVPHHSEIPYVAPDPGSLPRSLKKEEVDRKQVSPVYIAIKNFMQRHYNASQQQLTTSSDGRKSPRIMKLSPRKGGSEDGPITDPLVYNEPVVAKYKALLADGEPSGYEYLDLYANKEAPMVRGLRGTVDGLFEKGDVALPPVPSDGLQSVESQLLKFIYGQAVDSRKVGKQGHDVHTPMLFHVALCLQRTPAVDTLLGSWQTAPKTSEWKGLTDKGKWHARDGAMRMEHCSRASFAEADLTFRLFRMCWKADGSNLVFVEYFVRPDVEPAKWCTTYALAGDLSEEIRSRKLENQPSVLTIKARQGGQTVIKAGQKVIAIFDYSDTEKKDDVPRLAFKQGDVLEILVDDDFTGWLQCRDAKGKAGYVATNFVTLSQ